MKKIKVVLINHFSTSAIRERLDLVPESDIVNYRDIALWNHYIINGLKGRDDVELHVISPHVGMRRAMQTFEMDGVCYYFYRQEPLGLKGRIEARLRWQSNRNFPRNRKHTHRFIEKIQPDLVVLIGAENAYYSITALDVRDMPLMIQLQTVYANPDRVKNAGGVNKQRWNVEVQLFRKTPYMACTGRMYYDLVKGYNPDAIVFPRMWPVSKFPVVADIEKKYDFVYFARFLNKNKGFDNAIEAMGEFVKIYPNVRYLAVGSKDSDWPQFEKRIKELELERNLEIHGSFEQHIDLLSYVKQGRFALLPITMDVLSGTILEAMRMGMPVVTCRTSGTPSLNEKRETVLISDIGDIEGLCQNMKRLYESESLQATLRNNAALYLKEKDEANNHNVDKMVEQFKAVIGHYRNGTPIPQDLLYNTEVNKDYRKL